MTPEEQIVYDRRRKTNARILGLLLGAFAILIFFVTIAKLGIRP
jgi:predicted nucleic acid-binding Zn ribbon protein